jgi:hypothetical protein
MAVRAKKTRQKKLGDRKILGQGELREHRGGLVRSLQTCLHRQQLARDLIAGNAFRLIDDALQHALSLGLPGFGGCVKRFCPTRWLSAWTCSAAFGPAVVVTAENTAKV